jgi:hypothetical protein
MKFNSKYLQNGCSKGKITKITRSNRRNRMKVNKARKRAIIKTKIRATSIIRRTKGILKIKEINR